MVVIVDAIVDGYIYICCYYLVQNQSLLMRLEMCASSLVWGTNRGDT